MTDDSDRVIPATPRRREEARRQGAMPTAALLAWVAMAGTAALLLPVWAASTITAATALVRESIVGSGRGGAADWSLPAGLPRVAMPTVAVVLAAAAAGLAVRLILDGVTWNPTRALPSWRRIDPLAGFARVVSFRTVAAACGAGLGLAVVVVAAGLSMRPLLIVTDSVQAAATAWRATAWLIAAAAVVAFASWVSGRRRFERRIRMTPAEFADEARGAQADPKVRLLQQQRPRQPTAGAA